LPAYRIAGFPVHGICDLDTGRAQALAAAYGIERVYADAILPLLEQIREGASVPT
jgi:predicted dehydrogenase